MPSSSPNDLCFMSALELRNAYRARTLSPVEVTQAVLDRIERLEPTLNTFVTVTPEFAIEQARRCEAELMNGEPESLGALHGIPITVKDLTDTAGIRTTYGCKEFADHVPDTDDLTWSRLSAAGSVLVGKTTTPEFGMAIVTESALTGVTNNPWDPSRTVGGSSGGAAAAVAAGLAPLAWGSDATGSIRMPSACCGVVGLKASKGRIPLDDPLGGYGGNNTTGPLARTVADVALLLSVTAGPDPADPMSLPDEHDYLAAAERASVSGLRIAYALELTKDSGPLSEVVRDGFLATLPVFEQLGATVEPVELDLPEQMTFYRMSSSPGLAVFAEEASRQDPGWRWEATYPAIRKQVLEGRKMSAMDYVKNARKRAQTVMDLNEVFRAYDLLLTPTMPLPAFPHPAPEDGGNTHIDGIPVKLPMHNAHRLTAPFSDSGLPAISVPCGFSPDGLPLGLQIAATHRADALILQAAAAYQNATDWMSRRPPL